MRRVVIGLLIAVLSVAILARRSSPPPQSTAPPKLQVAATIFPLADWLREVGGPDVEVHCLVSGGGNPHHFEPTIKDAVAVSRARVLFAAGLGLDEWAGKLAANSGRGSDLALHETGAWIKALPFSGVPAPTGEAPAKATPHRTQGVEVELVRAHEHGLHDPHYWLDPARAVTVVTRMAQELGALDPQHREAYRQRGAAYVEKLKALDSEVAAQARTIPPGSQIVTFHDAYGYLLERLGIRLAAVVQASPGVEPSARDVSEALRILRAIGQRTVFHEPPGSGAAAEAIARELGAGLEALDPLDSEASSVGRTYLERMRHNLRVLVKAVRRPEAQ